MSDPRDFSRLLRLSERAKRKEHGAKAKTKEVFPHELFPLLFALCPMLCVTLIAVGTVIADRPPHRSVRAELPHTVLTVDVDMQTSRWDRGGGSSVSVASVCRAARTLPKSSGGLVGCVAVGCAAT